jgi:hypothetical protein
MFRHDTYGEDNISIHTQGDFTTVDFGYATLLLTRQCVSTLERQLAIVNHARRDYERIPACRHAWRDRAADDRERQSRRGDGADADGGTGGHIVSDAIKDGGPAFPQPCTESGHAANSPFGIAGGGLTLRDYFAAAALSGILADPTVGNDDVTVSEKADVRLGIAEAAFAFADAMLDARKAGAK